MRRSVSTDSKNLPSLMNITMELRKCCNHPFLIRGAESTVIEEICAVYPFRSSVDALEKIERPAVLPLSVQELAPELALKYITYASGKMVVLDKPVYIGLIPAIAMAAYTTWKITMASIHMARQRRRAGGNILVAELRTVNFIDALVAILTLQNTLIMVNRTATDANAMLPVSAASSAVIYAVIVSITVRMLRKGLRQTGTLPCGKQT